MALEPLFHQPTFTSVQVIVCLPDNLSNFCCRVAYICFEILMNMYLSMSDHPEGAETVYVRTQHLRVEGYPRYW
jgi:hypothetical protein